MGRGQRRRLPAARAAVAALGAMVAAGRRQRGWTAAEFAERLGTSLPTLRSIERGEPGVSIGLFLEAAVLAGVELFSSPSAGLSRVEREARLRTALLPERVRTAPAAIDDNF
jgi:transcriptional regulator with XRE-family HTH domain